MQKPESYLEKAVSVARQLDEIRRLRHAKPLQRKSSLTWGARDSYQCSEDEIIILRYVTFSPFQQTFSTQRLDKERIRLKFRLEN